jgi:hypothetical protein
MYGGWATYIAFWSVMATLRYTHHRAAKRHWVVWRLIVMKAVILIVAEVAIAMSGAEICKESLTVCHQVLSFTEESASKATPPTLS